MAWCDVVEPRTLRECRIALGQSQAAFSPPCSVCPPNRTGRGSAHQRPRTRSTQEFEKRFPGQAGVADQCSQETTTKLPVSRYREPPAGRPDQDHVTAFHAIERESDPGDRRDELVSRDDRKSRHLYTRTSTT